MKIYVQDHSGIDNNNPAVVAVPKDSMPSLPAARLGGIDYPLRYWKPIGDQSDLFTVALPLTGGQLQEAEVVSGVQRMQHTLHTYVTDDPAALLSTVFVELMDGQMIELPFGAATFQQSEARQTWRWTTAVGGFILKMEQNFDHLSPVGHIEGALIWSDRGVTATEIQVKAVAIVTREIFVPSFQEAYSIGPRVYDAASKTFTVRLSGPRFLIDGSGIPIAGRLLCTPQDGDWGDEAVAQWSIQNLIAAEQGGGRGVADGWQSWLAHGNIPQFSSEDTEAVGLMHESHKLAGAFGAARDLYDRRPKGCEKVAYQVGGQEDFSAGGHGWEVIKGLQPGFLEGWLWCAHAELFRGYTLFEDDGSPVQSADHPNWQSLNGYTHYSRYASPDRLGKDWPAWVDRDATGWRAHDNQHISFNHLAATYALTGSYICELVMQAFQQHQLADAYRNRRFNGLGRAPGRAMLAFAHFARLTQGADKDRWMQLLVDKVYRCHEHREAHNSPSWRLKPLAVDRSKDPRSAVYDPSTGELADVWNVWELGLFCVGAYAAWKALLGTLGSQAVETLEAHELLVENLTAIVDGALFEMDGGLLGLADNVRWLPDGSRLPDDAYTLPLAEGALPQITTQRDPSHPTGVATWTFPAILIAAYVLPQGSELQEKAARFVYQVTDGREATLPVGAVWWCVVPSVADVLANYLAPSEDA